jgi:copper chaperone CopZ
MTTRSHPPGSSGFARLPLAVALAAIAALALGGVLWLHRPAPAAGVVVLEVGGMQCSACVEKVHHELVQVPGVKQVDVDLTAQRAVVRTSRPVADSTLTAAVRRAGPEYLGLVLSR